MRAPIVLALVVSLLFLGDSPPLLAAFLLLFFPPFRCHPPVVFRMTHSSLLLARSFSFGSTTVIASQLSFFGKVDSHSVSPRCACILVTPLMFCSVAKDLRICHLTTCVIASPF